MTTSAQAAAVHSAKLSLDINPVIRDSFGANVLLPLTLDTPTVPHDINRICWFFITVFGCQILSDLGIF